MQELIHVNKTFNKDVYSEKSVNKREFDNCTFIDCDFSNSNFSNNRFNECEFVNCNLSMIQLGKTVMYTVHFRDCKLLGINFHECDDFLFGVNFENSILDYSSFIRKKMPKTKFLNSSLREVAFIETILTGSQFENVNLAGAVFNRTDLRGVDFKTAINYDIDPEFNNIQKAKFSLPEAIRLLSKYDLKIE